MSVNIHSLSNAPACTREDWLPEGQWPEMDELRAEHVRLLGLLRSNAAEAQAVHRRFEEEDERRRAAVQARTAGEAVEIPSVTPEPERRAAVQPFRDQGASIRRALDELANRVLATAAAKADDWFVQFDEEEAAARRQIKDAQAAIEAALSNMALRRAKRQWVFRTAGLRWSSPRARCAPFPTDVDGSHDLTVAEALSLIGDRAADAGDGEGDPDDPSYATDQTHAPRQGRVKIAS